MTPPIDWFRNPQLAGPTPVTVLPDGRVYGHVATWESIHIGHPGENVPPPRSATDYGYFHIGATTVLDGESERDISCGKLTLDTGHAPLVSDANSAASHYDNTGTEVANVCAGEDEYGVWFAGAVAPGVDDLKRHKLKSSAVSGDWRPVKGPHGWSNELVAALMVNAPGFPIPRARVASAAEIAPLVAANVVPNPVQEDVVPEIKTYKKGDVVELTASAQIGEVVEVLHDGTGAVVELCCAADEIKPSSSEAIVAASARRTERMEVRRLASQVEQLTASLAARDRADEAARLLSDVDL